MSILFRRYAGKLRRNPIINFRHSDRPKIGLLHTFAAASQVGATTGLYGYHHLKTPRGFQRFADDAIERSGELVTYISSTPSSAEVIRAMDEISNTVCSVMDAAELCRNTHPDREFVDEANKTWMRLHEYLHYLNTNHTLYDAVKKVERERHLLTEEAHRAACFLRADFERGGIHLCVEKLDRVNQLNIEISQLCGEFNENIVIDPGYVDIFPSSRIPRNLHRLVRPIYRSTPATSSDFLYPGNTVKEIGFRITTDPPTLSSILQLTPDEEVRKMAYVQGYSSPQANLGILNKLIGARHELAQILGYRSYAEFVLKNSMASSPSVVMSFLQEMSKMVRSSADEELKKIKDFKRNKCLLSLEPWDETYYTAIMKSSAYNFDSSVVASYFPLPQCIEGLKVLVESLFGATFCSVPLAPGESWHPDVIKMLLHHPEEGDLGYLYLDLQSRKGKYPGCAHFSLKGGRQVSETDYQLPVVALVCNFSGSHDQLNVRLKPWELETLFHEFGHALHSLLSRTDYQQFSGTRVALDLAETPSNLFEYYACDYRVLKTFARHYSTGEVIPQKLVDSLEGARNMFSATELQRQIFYAMIDQTIFGEQPSPPRDTSSIVADLKTQYTSWRHVEGTHWHVRFSHLLNYGAGYYGYLYSKCFAASIWQKVCKEDPLSLSTGEALRTKFLQHGGAREPADLLKGLVGDGVLRYCDGGIVPDITSLCDEMKLN
ncbi:Mitochondrial intermediate peptidase [Morus notabilis]|uniref:Mitochondrial intermediate peptidase n=1 Tax=Morus notabilis TaxID=981085 RepID=W9RRS3_9ROSA|nr:mitochondrial intermediate peptidase, mitochondrial [Morus notabilis]EXB89501.1 Mitochondrial intermediate peptidase [Morus notabilis]